MALDTALTNTTTTSQAIKSRYYDELFLRQADKKFVHKQLGQLNRKVPSGEGGYGSQVLYWTKWVNFPTITSGTGEGVPTSALTFSAVNVTGSTAQYDNAVSISDIMAYASFGDVMKAAIERMAYNAGLSIDTVVRNVLYTAGTQQSASAVAYWSAVPAGANLIISEIRKAARTLSANDATEQDDGNWVAVAHPHAIYKIFVALYRKVYRKFREFGGTLKKLRQYRAELSLEIEIEGVQTMYGTPLWVMI